MQEEESGARTPFIAGRLQSPARFSLDGWAIAALLALAAWLFHGLPSGYWRGDDPALVAHAMKSPGLSAFYDPANWHLVSASNLTPWLTLSFKFDLWLAGVSAPFFYCHQLVSIALVAVAAYALARQWFESHWAFLFVALFLVGAPTGAVAESLMTRHYLEGLLFALLSLLAFVHALGRRSMPLACVAAFAYALACTAKEVYVPLIVFVLLLVALTRELRALRLVLPFLIVAMLYTLWRSYMLGGVVGGYSEGNSILSTPAVLAFVRSALHFPGFLFGAAWPVAMVLIALAAAAALYKAPAGIAVALVAGAAILGPLVPLASFPGLNGADRYLFVVWCFASWAIVWCVRRAVALLRMQQGPRAAIALFMVALVAVPAVAEGRRVEASRIQYDREVDAQGRFIFENDSSEAFVPTASLLSAYWYVTGLCDIKNQLGKDCPAAVIKGVPPGKEVRRLYAYDAGQGAMADISGRKQQALLEMASVDGTRPLSGRLSLDNGFAHWQLGPYGSGQYYFASSLFGRYPVGPSGQFKTIMSDISLYIQYESPEGWITSSPELKVKRGHPVEWQRGAGAASPS